MFRKGKWFLIKSNNAHSSGLQIFSFNKDVIPGMVSSRLFKYFTIASISEREWCIINGLARMLPSERFKVHSYLLVKQEQINCHNLLNRMQEYEGWLTHLSSGVVSQFEILLDNRLQYKRKVKAVKTLTYILRIWISRIADIADRYSFMA